MAELNAAERTGFQQFREEFANVWAALPFKGLFLLLLALWFGIFHLLGSSTLGYTNTPSLFGWMDYVLSQTNDDQHGPWMLVAIVILLWWKRRELLDAPEGNWWPALGLLLAAVVIHALGYMVQQTRISVVGFFVGIYALIGLVWGLRMMRATFFPILLFCFCLPLGGTLADSATLPLRIIATKITTWVCHGAFGINVQQNGTQLFDPNHAYSYEVAAACSGIRSLTATLALAVIYAFVVLRSPWRRVAMIATTVPLAISANVFRLTSIVIASEAFGQKAGNYVHESWWTSLMPYIPMIGGILLIGHWLKKGEGAAGRKEAATSAWGNRELGTIFAFVAALFILRELVPSFKSWTAEHQYSSTFIAIALGLSALIIWSRSTSPAPAFDRATRSLSVGTLALALLMLMGASLGLQYRHNHQKLGNPGVKVARLPVYDPEGKLAGTNSVALPDAVAGYKSKVMPISRMVLDWLPKDTTYSQRLYTGDDGFESQVNVVLMGTDRTSIHQPQYCLTGQGYRIEQSEVETVPIDRPRAYQLPVNKLTVSGDFTDRDGRRFQVRGLYVYWFVAENRLTAEHGQRMLDMGLEMLRTGVLQRWAYVSCFSLCLPGQEQATYARMKDLIAATVPEFQTATGNETVLARNP